MNFSSVEETLYSDFELIEHVDNINDVSAHISFIDCPGHDAYMATMLGASHLFDAVILVIGNDGPQRQTQEHLMVWDILYQHKKGKSLNA